jgi:hypothetical protein
MKGGGAINYKWLNNWSTFYGYDCIGAGFFENIPFPLIKLNYAFIIFVTNNTGGSVILSDKQRKKILSVYYYYYCYYLTC